MPRLSLLSSVCPSHSTSPHPPSLLYCVPVAFIRVLLLPYTPLDQGTAQEAVLTISGCFFSWIRHQMMTTKLSHCITTLNPSGGGATGLRWFSESPF